MNRFVESDVRWVFTVELPDEDEGFFLGAENIPRCMHYVIGILIANENKGGVNPIECGGGAKSAPPII